MERGFNAIDEGPVSNRTRRRRTGQNRRKRLPWCDGNPVNISTTADGSDIGSVAIQIGQEKYKVQSPISIQQYNRNMDAVDRWDQLLGKYALHRRHKFMKYYKNIMLVIIDFAILQAEIHYNLENNVNQQISNRAEWYEQMANDMIFTDWERVVTLFKSRNHNIGTVRNMENGDHYENVLYNMGAYISPQVCSQKNRDQCSPVAASTNFSSPDGRTCLICKFEGRGRKMTHVNYCMNHKVRCCSISHGNHTQYELFFSVHPKMTIACIDWTWMCKNHDWKFWRKFHDFYYPNGYFHVHDSLNNHKNPILTNNNKHPAVIRRKKAISMLFPPRNKGYIPLWYIEFVDFNTYSY